jgi:hypothetical protein
MVRFSDDSLVLRYQQPLEEVIPKILNGPFRLEPGSPVFVSTARGGSRGSMCTDVLPSKPASFVNMISEVPSGGTIALLAARPDGARPLCQPHLGVVFGLQRRLATGCQRSQLLKTF